MVVALSSPRALGQIRCGSGGRAVRRRALQDGHGRLDLARRRAAVVALRGSGSANDRARSDAQRASVLFPGIERQGNAHFSSAFFRDAGRHTRPEWGREIGRRDHERVRPAQTNIGARAQTQMANEAPLPCARRARELDPERRLRGVSYGGVPERRRQNAPRHPHPRNYPAEATEAPRTTPDRSVHPAWHDKHSLAPPRLPASSRTVVRGRAVQR